MNFRVGCCGFGGRQASYYERFQVVEIQKTFYQPPLIKTALRWRREAPAGFCFTLKAWQLITHSPSSPTYRRLSRPVSPERAKRLGGFRPTQEVQDAWRVTREIAEALEACVVVFQCPASFTHTRENVRNLTGFFSKLPRGDLCIAWEPRGPWPPDLVRELCAGLDLIHCVDPFKDQCITEGPIYYRLHGVGGYHYSYSDGDLQKLQLLCKGREGYVMFNNTTMNVDALRFIASLQGVKGPAA